MHFSPTFHKRRDSLIYSVFELVECLDNTYIVLLPHFPWLDFPGVLKGFPNFLEPQQLLVNHRSIHVMYLNGALLKTERNAAVSMLAQTLQEAQHASLCQG